MTGTNVQSWTLEKVDTTTTLRSPVTNNTEAPEVRFWVTISSGTVMPVKVIGVLLPMGVNSQGYQQHRGS